MEKTSHIAGYIAVMALAISVMLGSFQLFAQGKERPMEHSTFYRTTKIDGPSIFYREAGPKNAPTLLLLHGLPSSSQMFEPLFARLSDRYHLIAPDYPATARTCHCSNWKLDCVLPPQRSC